MSYCDWNGNEEQRKYHDEIWGRPVHDDFKHFEYISYEVMQCGLGWWLVYGKRNVLKKCFDDFDFRKVAAYDEEDIDRIMSTPGMIKSIQKIKGIINNAQAFIKTIEKYGSFDSFLWSFTEGKTVIYDKHEEGFIPSSNGLSEKISKSLKKQGYKFMGPVVIYSHLQACGMILDHDPSCPCYKEIVDSTQIVRKRRYLEKGIVNFNEK